MKAMRKLTALVLAAALAGAPVVLAGQAEQDEAARNYFTDLEVIDQNGKRLRFYSDVLQDRVVLLNVIFTNCQGACPLITQVLKDTRANLVDAITDDVWFVSVSTDPERDTPQALKAFAKKQNVDESRWVFLTGSKDTIDLILNKLKRYNANIDMHSTQLLAGTTRERHQWVPLPAGAQADAIAAVLRSLAEPPPG
jgi:cytochrome oxidase Cu insertion factor (SCO1/SenC/PrrC family)